jgi:hypothetical protein
MRLPQRGQRSVTRVSTARRRRRTSGSDGSGGGPVPGCVAIVFFSEPQMLQESERQQAHQSMMVQPTPGAALEVIEPALVFHL